MKTIGKSDKIDLPEFGLENISAKIDTGANRSCIHCSDIHVENTNGQNVLVFHIPLDSSHGASTFRFNTFSKKAIRSSNGLVEERYIIKTVIVLFGRKIRTSFSLTDRTEMKFPILLGRRLLKSRFLVDVSQQDLSYNLKRSKRNT